MVILPEDFVIFSDTASLRELDPFMKQDPEADLSGFYPAALQAGADKGKQYALPLECVPQMMFINKTLLQKEHIRIPDNDWTWDEFYSLCEQLTRDTDGDGIVDQFGVYDYGWEEALVANGCSLFSEDGQHCLLNQSAQESAVQFARKIYQLNAGTDLSEKPSTRAEWRSARCCFPSTAAMSRIRGASSARRTLSGTASPCPAAQASAAATTPG